MLKRLARRRSSLDLLDINVLETFGSSAYYLKHSYKSPTNDHTERLIGVNVYHIHGHLPTIQFLAGLRRSFGNTGQLRLCSPLRVLELHSSHILVSKLSRARFYSQVTTICIPKNNHLISKSLL